MKKCSACLLAFLFTIFCCLPVQATEKNDSLEDLSCIAMSPQDAERYWKSISPFMVNTPMEKGSTISSFAVNSQGNLALCFHGEGWTQIDLYTSTGQFQYGIRFGFTHHSMIDYSSNDDLLVTTWRYGERYNLGKEGIPNVPDVQRIIRNKENSSTYYQIFFRDTIIQNGETFRGIKASPSSTEFMAIEKVDTDGKTSMIYTGSAEYLHQHRYDLVVCILFIILLIAVMGGVIFYHSKKKQ